jgi:antitoxin VapB
MLPLRPLFLIQIVAPFSSRLSRYKLARRRGENITDAVLAALREQLRREQAKIQPPGLAEDLLEIGRRFSALPVLDDRSDDDILGYDAQGLPR